MASQKTPFDYGAHMRMLTEDVVAKTPEFRHIRLDAVVFSISRSRSEGLHGQFAKIIPMRFEGGSDIRIYKRRRYRLPALVVGGREVMYAIFFCLPKFQNLPFEEKMLTLFHELYHIHPEFNGDIRRFPGRNYAHGESREAYNSLVRPLVNAYLSREPAADRLGFLKPTADELFAEYGSIVATRIAVPKLVPVEPLKKRDVTRNRTVEGGPEFSSQ